MKRFEVCALGIVVFGFEAALMADPVEIPHVFVAGQPAVAAEVNDNFLSVKAAVDDNFTRTLTLGAEDIRLSGLMARLEATLGIQPFSEKISLSGPLQLATHHGVSLPTSSSAPFGIVTTYQEYNGVRDEALYYG